MPRHCTTCTHPQRAEIELAIVGGRRTYRDIAEKFGLSRSALNRHAKQHLPTDLLRSVAAADSARIARLHEGQHARADSEAGHAIDIVRQLKAINAASLEILQKARESGQDSISLRAVDRIHKQIELQARLLGEIQDGPQVNVLVSAEWHQVRAVILSSLDRHPEARSEVLNALQAVADAGI